MTDNAAIRAADKIWQLGPSKPAGEMTEIDLERLKESHAAIIASQYAPLVEAARMMKHVKYRGDANAILVYDMLMLALAAVEDSDEPYT